MRTKTGRFNYLPNYQESPEGRDSIERAEYKEIISKLTREYQPKNRQEILAFDSPPRRSYSPIRQIQLKTRQGSSNHIRSIVLNEQITVNKQQEQKQKQRLSKDAYRIIKDSHVPSNQNFHDFCQTHKTPPKNNYPFKEHKFANQNQQQPIIKFYQINPNVPDKEIKRTNTSRKNQPYINLEAKIYEQSEKNQASFNPQSKQVTPTKVSDLASSRTNNKIYKVGCSQERIYPHQISINQNFIEPPLANKDKNLHSFQKSNMRKRSCYDYVPQQMKSRLRRQQ